MVTWFVPRSQGNVCYFQPYLSESESGYISAINGVVTLLIAGSGPPSFSVLLETNSLHLKMDGWKMKIRFGIAHFQGQTAEGVYPFTFPGYGLRTYIRWKITNFKGKRM